MTKKKRISKPKDVNQVAKGIVDHVTREVVKIEPKKIKQQKGQ